MIFNPDPNKLANEVVFSNIFQVNPPSSLQFANKIIKSVKSPSTLG